MSIELDAASPDLSVVVEIYAHQGRLRGAQSKKIAQDILKLALLKQESDFQNTTAIVAFASREAQDSITGWLRQAAEAFGIELVTVAIGPELSAAISLAQSRQAMTNADQAQ